jgi:exodeoxyribonuclease-3
MMLRLMSYNIRFGGAGREAALASTIASVSPDVVIFQEASNPNVIARLAAETGMKHWAAKRGRSVGFMSRFGITQHGWRQPAPSRRAFLEVELERSDVDGIDVRIYGLHLSALHSNWTERVRMAELKAMLAEIAEDGDGLSVVLGDFNTLAPGEKLDVNRLPPHLRILAWLGGQTIRWQTIQVMLDAHYVDAYRSLHPLDPGHTFPTWDPHLRLDYAFFPATAAERLQRCEVVGGPAASIASDHLPLLVEFEV